jgi:RNA polymerase sigma-70 factor (ECF subfamily)
MAGGATKAFPLKHLHILYRVGAVGNLTDGELLEQFLAGREDMAEAVFTALVERHGPMVLRVCRQVLGDVHDAQDAFQATFLVLVRDAGSVRNRDSVASWLHGVALRVAKRAKSGAARRRAHERRAAVPESIRDADRPERWPELHEEIARLPEKYRAAVVLCYLEGLTTEAAAHRLGCPQGTVMSRLSRARDQLHGRLTRRGVAGPAGLLALGLAPKEAPAGVSAALANLTIQAALKSAGGRVSTGVVSAPVATMTNAISRSIFMIRSTMTVAALATLGVVAVGLVVLARQEPGGGKRAEAQQIERAERVAAADTGPAKDDREAIQGTWRVVSAQDNGRPVLKTAPGGKQTDGLKLVITSDAITCQAGDVIHGKGSYRLDPSKMPKWIDLTEKDGRPEPGIYSLEGNDLTVCYNEAGTERPNRFASEAGTPNDVLLVLRREVPAPKGPDAPPSPNRGTGPQGLVTHLLEVRIVADLKNDPKATEETLGPDGLEVPRPGYRWVRLEDRSDDRYEGAIIRELAKDRAMSRKYLLVKLDTCNVNEGDLAEVYKTEDERDFPAIGFRLKPDGARRFGDLTRNHLPEDKGKTKYRLAIILEGSAVSAPFINSEVRDGGIIQFGGKDQLPEEVDRLVKLLASAIPPDIESAKK